MAKKHSFAKGVATGLLGTAATVAELFSQLRKQSSNQKKRNWLSSKKTVKKQLAVV